MPITCALNVEKLILEAKLNATPMQVKVTITTQKNLFVEAVVMYLELKCAPNTELIT